MTGDSTAEPTITLDAVLDLLEHWRSNKSSYPNSSIPDEIWQQVFALESQGRHTGSTLRKLFGLNSSQYKRKRTELCSPPKPEQSSKEPSSSTPLSDVAIESTPATTFAEAVVAPLTPTEPPSVNGTTKADLSRLKSTKEDGLSFLAQSTIIVECIRPDGHRLKIHTTHNSLDSVMQSFFSQEAASA